MYADDGHSDGHGLSPSLVGLILGISAAIPMYLWQMSPQVAVATFIIIGYTARLWTASLNGSVLAGVLHGELRGLPINRTFRRIARMLMDPGFWWSMLFGGSTVTGSVWYAGMHHPGVMVGISGVWCLITGCLCYGMTLVNPASRCRKCGHDLRAQMAMEGSVIMCPECGSRWSRTQLGQSTHATSSLDWRHAA